MCSPKNEQCHVSTHDHPERWPNGPPPKRRLLRKEVVQPQVPLRLPCYDFIPVTSPTLDACLPEGLARRLGVKPAPMM
jgi:hypothetical protein